MIINNPEIVVIDYNTGNVDSVIKASKLFNLSVELTNSHKVIENAKKIILPGQGSFSYGMEQLHNLRLVDLIKDKDFGFFKWEKRVILVLLDCNTDKYHLLG